MTLHDPLANLPGVDDRPPLGARRNGQAHKRGSAFGSREVVGRPRLSIFTGADLHGLPVPEREWTVEGIIPSGTVTLFGGDGGTGKSLLALQLASAVATGRQWLRRPVAEGPAVYLSAEDDRDELHRRLASIARAEDLPLAEMRRLTLASLAGQDALLAHLDGSGALEPTPLFHELGQRIAEDRPAVVVLDTLADLFPGNENDRAQARQFVGMLRGLAIRNSCAVVLLSHPSLTGMSSGTGASGSTAWNNSVRSRLYLERVASDGYEPDPDARTLTTKKSNYARTGAELSMRWQGGVFVADEPETGMDRKAKGAKAERVFLKLLRLFAEQERTVNAKGGANYAPKVFAEHPDGEGITKRAFQSAMEALLARGAIRNETYGPASRRVTKLVEASE